MAEPTRELPYHVRENYLEYKRRHRSLTAWLIENGKTNTVKQDTADTQQLSLEDIKRLTSTVVSRSVKISEDMLYVCRSMLTMRKEVGRFYNDNDAGHVNVIDIFQKILCKLILLPRHHKPGDLPRGDQDDESNIAATADPFSLLPSVHYEGIGHESVLGDISNTIRDASRSSTKASNKMQAQKNMAKMLRIAEFDAIQKMFDLLTSMSSWVTECLVHIADRAFFNYHLAHSSIYFFLTHAWTLKPASPSPQDLLDGLKHTLDGFNSREMHGDMPTSSGCGTAYITPLSHLITFSEAMHDQDQLCNALMLGKRKSTYAHCIPLHESGDEVGAYYMSLLQDMEHKVYEQSKESPMALLPHCMLGACLSGMCQTEVDQTFVGLSSCMSFLLRTAQAVAHAEAARLGHSAAGDDCNGLVGTNYRLKSLCFAQEVLVAARQRPTASEANDLLIPDTVLSEHEQFETRIKIYLRKNRFDLVTEHPIIAGTDMLWFLDTAYAVGIKLLSCRHFFLGPLHVYSALRGLGIMEAEIPVLEALRSLMLDAVFFGSLPTNNFVKVWRVLDGPHDNARMSASEYCLRRVMDRQSKLSNSVQSMFVSTNRGQYRLGPECRHWCNDRLLPEHFSFLHREYDRKNYAATFVSDRTKRQWLGNDLSALVDYQMMGRSSGKADIRAKQELDHVGIGPSLEPNMVLFKEALIKELAEPFPLIRANLYKIWRHCNEISVHLASYELSKYPQDLGVERVLRDCDEIVAARNSGLESGMSKKKNEKLFGKDSLVMRWKRALEDELGGKPLEDFLWKNI